MKPMKLACIAAAACAAYSITSPAATTAEASSAPEEPGVALDEVTVTARKRDEVASRIPETVNVLGAEDLEERNVSGLNDVQYLMPAFSFNQFQDPSVNY